MLTTWGRLLVKLAAWMMVGGAYEVPKIHKRISNRRIREDVLRAQPRFDSIT